MPREWIIVSLVGGGGGGGGKRTEVRNNLPPALKIWIVNIVRWWCTRTSQLLRRWSRPWHFSILGVPTDERQRKGRESGENDVIWISVIWKSKRFHSATKFNAFTSLLRTLFVCWSCIADAGGCCCHVMPARREWRLTASEEEAVCCFYCRQEKKPIVLFSHHPSDQTQFIANDDDR